jgi:predicted AAA+ superfamily ATPase
MVASYFFTSQKTTQIPYGIFYSPESEGVDFVLSDIEGEIIPVEVGAGKKNKRQIKKSIKNYNSKYGIVISDARTRITREEDVIYIPITTFSLN